jgi:Fe-S oxidoreductase/nitrate reductase gamma subunit
VGDALTPARDVFRNLGTPAVALFYLLGALAIVVFCRGAWQRIRKYRRGRSSPRGRFAWMRVRDGLGKIASHSTLRARNAGTGLAHFGIFWGFVALFVGTVIIMIDYDMVRLVAPEWRFWRGAFYRWYSLALDVAGVLFLAGLAAMGARRFAARPAALDYTRPDRVSADYDRRGYLRDDALFLWLLLAIGVTGYVVEAARIAADRPPFETWSVVGWQLANGLDALGVSPRAANGLHWWSWWGHAVLALGFVAYVPYSKAVPMLVDGVNLLAHDPAAGRALPAPLEGGASAGYATLADFTWKELLDLDACTKCGRCHIACPARAAGAPLSPRDLILGLRERAEDELGGRSLLRELPAGTNGDDRKLIGTVVRPETLWACTTCLACVAACPVGIEHLPLIVELRRTLVEDGALEPGLQDALQKLDRYGNSFGQSERARAKWTQGLPFPVKDARKEEVEYLWFVGDYASYNPRVQETARAFARVLQRAAVDFGLLHEGERNAGNDVRRVGEEGLFEKLAAHNVKAMERCKGFRAIVTTDPHSYNTLRNEYPALGLARPVLHYSELLLRLFGDGRLAAARPLGAAATYHDPCYLGRYNGVFDAPREVLARIGVRLVEMGRCRDNSFCCGAGGGRIWMDDAGLAERPSENRIREAVGLGSVQYFVVACPKDVTMYEDAVKTSGQEGRIVVRDLIELVEEAL